MIGNGTDPIRGRKNLHVLTASNYVTSKPETLRACGREIQNNKTVEDDGSDGFITKRPGDYLQPSFLILLKMRPFASIATIPIVHELTESNYGTIYMSAR